MGVILGTMTQVIIGGVSTGFQSINWNITRQPNRLWQLGRWQPYKTQLQATVTISVTTYAGILSSVALAASASCADSTAYKSVILNASSCDPATTVNLNFPKMFITSYSYSKGDPMGFGAESWSFQRWVDPSDYGPVSSTYFIIVGEPTYVLQGITEGSRSGDVTNLGISFYPDSSAGTITGWQGSVSAGNPGIGNADEVTLGVVSRIGGGDLEASGKMGQSSATVPHQPLYVG